MDELQLRDKEIFPTHEVLKAALGNSFPAYEKLEQLFSEQGLISEWRYYNDGKAWMGKMLNKKKNLGWIHIYDNHFKVTFLFMERHIPQIQELEISDELKSTFYEAVKTNPGKLTGMRINMDGPELSEDLLTVLLFKRKLK